MNRSFDKLTIVLVMIMSVLVSNALIAQRISFKRNNKPKKIKALIVAGQSISHPHQAEWIPVLVKHLDESDLFYTDIVTSPPAGDDMSVFNPKFGNYDVVISVYSGDPWPEKIKKRFDKYVMKGGGVVIVHGANNAFPDWEQYNLITGLGGWGDRDENNGPYVYYDDKDSLIYDKSPGKGGFHGPKHEFVITSRAPDHPIMKGLPLSWLHTTDELYEQLRGPAENMTVLATAFASREFEGSGRHEPQLMTIRYGNGRVFHTTMGHDQTALLCVGFKHTFLRGCEWTATGKVTQNEPDNFPTEQKSMSEDF